MNPSTELYYNSPAADWNDALPVGNGRMGGMVFGSLPMSSSSSTRIPSGQAASETGTIPRRMIILKKYAPL